MNADGNMPYDICEDESALDYIEGEMARRGVTQELIDETRASTETQMLHDLEVSTQKQGPRIDRMTSSRKVREFRNKASKFIFGLKCLMIFVYWQKNVSNNF